MAQAQGIQLERERFCCSLCSSLFNNPVTVPCGHCFCLSCITKHFDDEQVLGIYSCPQCREISMQRPHLVKNSMIEHIVQQLMLSADPADDPLQECYAGPEDVTCGFCSEKVKAVKSCLQCLASYCERHLQSHSHVAHLRKHKLVEATTDLEESICSHHQEVMKMFCRTDQCCICYLCSKDGHKGHNKVSTAAERAERQRELQAARNNIRQRIQEKEKDVSAFQQEEDEIYRSADIALVSAEKAFTELTYTMKKNLSHITESIQSRQTADVGRYRNVRVKVEKEIDELNRKDADLEKLSHTENHTHFLMNYSSLCHLDDYRYQPSYKLRRQRNFERVTAVVSDARNKLQEVLNEESEKILRAITGTNGLPPVCPTSQETPASSGQTTAEFVRSRLVHNRVSPTFPRPNGLQNQDGFMQGNTDAVDSSHFQTRTTPKPSKKNLKVPKPAIEVNGHDAPSSKSKQDIPVPKPAPERSSSAPIHVYNRKISQAKGFPNQDDMMQNTGDTAETNNHLIPGVSQHSVNNQDSTRLTPDILLRRVSSKENLLDLSPLKISPLNTRSDFLKYAKKITLDPNTANPHLLLRKDYREAMYMSEELPYSHHPERFAYSWQVLSKQSLTGRCYLEVEGRRRGALVALTYKDISRSGPFSECMFGQNDKSWALDCFKSSCEFRHNKIKTPIPGKWAPRVGVYLDHSAGSLSFYSVSDTMILLHKVQVSFTQPLYVGLWLSDGAAAKVCRFS